MGKGSKPRPLSVERDTFADRWSQTFGARRELTRLLNPDRCGTCEGEGRDPDHHKNACPECGGDGKQRREAA